MEAATMKTTTTIQYIFERRLRYNKKKKSINYYYYE